MEIDFRWIVRADLAEVERIENASFEFPWTRDDFCRSLASRPTIGYVAEPAKFKGKTLPPVIAYAIYQLMPIRLHIINFAVSPEYRRQGVGAAMIRKLCRKLAPQRRRLLSMEIREKNLEAQLFAQQMGFRCTAILNDFYPDSPGEAAYLFEREWRPTDSLPEIPTASQGGK